MHVQCHKIYILYFPSMYVYCLDIFSSNVIRKNHIDDGINKGNSKITELRTILKRESQNSLVYKQTKSVNNRKTVKTVMTLTWYRHF
jgi:hypothetical protein